MQNQEVYDELVAKFEAKYGQKPQIVAYASSATTPTTTKATSSPPPSTKAPSSP